MTDLDLPECKELIACYLKRNFVIEINKKMNCFHDPESQFMNKHAVAIGGLNRIITMLDELAEIIKIIQLRKVAKT